MNHHGRTNLFEVLGLSEGVPHEVFGPRVWWGRGQVISDLSQRRRCRNVVVVVAVALPPKKQKNRYWDTWTKNVKNDLNIALVRGLVFPEIVFSEKKKESTATQEEQGSKKEAKSEFSLELIFCFVKTGNRVLPNNWDFDGNFQSKTRILVKTS